MKVRDGKIGLYICGLIFIIFGLINYIIQGTPFNLSTLQIGMIIVGVGLILSVYFYKRIFSFSLFLIKLVKKIYVSIGQMIKDPSYARNFAVRYLGLNWIKPCVIYIKKHPWFAIVPIIFASILLVWPSPKSYFTSDVSYYLSLAKNLYFGNGYVNPDLSPAIYRGPIFPILISFSFLLFGNTFNSALIMMRIFWVMTVLLTYLLGKELYNHRVGFLGSLLVLTSGVISRNYEYIWTDGVTVFFMLVVQLLFWIAIKNNRSAKWYLFIGFLMGLAYLAKQTAVIIVPLPFLVWMIIPEYRTREIFKRIIGFYLVFAVFFFGWMVYVYNAGGSPGQVTRDLKIGTSVLSYITNAFTNISKFFSSGIGKINRSSSILQLYYVFYTRDIGLNFWFAPIFLIGIVYLFFQALFKKIKPDIFLMLSFLLFSTLIPVNAVNNFGTRQSVYFFIISLICIASFLDRIIANTPKLIPLLVVIIIVVGMNNFKEELKNFPEVSKFSRNQVPLNYFPDFVEAANWIDVNIKTDENILTTERDSNIFHILTEGNRTFYPINTCIGEDSFYIARKCTPPYINYWINLGLTDPEKPRDNLMGISEGSFISTIHDKNIKYVVVTPFVYSLYYYLNVHPDFEKVVVLKNAAIFRVKSSVEPISNFPQINWSTCVGEGTGLYLTNLKGIDPDAYETRFQNKIQPWMGLSMQELESFMDWKGCRFKSKFPKSFEDLQ